jgi:hypothetical protein
VVASSTPHPLDNLAVRMRLLVGKDTCLALLATVRARLHPTHYRALYGQVLDTEELADLRSTYREIRSHVPTTP